MPDARRRELTRSFPPGECRTKDGGSLWFPKPIFGEPPLY